MKVAYKVNYNERFNEWFVKFLCDGRADTDVRGTYGTGCKSFPTEKQAVNSGKRYVRTMVANGFTK